MMTRAVRGESGHPHEEKTNKLGRTLRPLFIFTEDGKTNKSIVMPDPNFQQEERRLSRLLALRLADPAI